MSKVNDIQKILRPIQGQLCDMEWRIFKEWQRVIPAEPFEAFKKDSIIKRALKENIKIDNLV